jgi:splicing suppressor protein 51
MSDLIASVLDMSSLCVTPPDPSKATCTTCKTPQSTLLTPLKRCAQCHTQQYCSRDCQKADWKAHKKVCDSNASNPFPRPAGAHNPGFITANALFGGDDDELHQMSEKDLYVRLIDCFRMRMEDEYVFAGNNFGIYGGEDARPVFRKFLGLAEKREGLLPKWWSQAKKRECEKVALSHEWADITCCVEKSDVIEHYGNPMMPMKLRILGEKIYGEGFM